MTETIKVRKLKQLEIDSEGRITLEGKVVDARPMGLPFPVVEKFVLSTLTRPKMKLDKISSEELEKFIEQRHHYLVPTANAYISGWLNSPFEKKKLIVVYGVQFYKVSDKKE